MKTDTRRTLSIALDVGLVAAVLFVTFTLPLFPDPNKRSDTLRALIRLIVTLVFGLRTLGRLSPLILMGLENVGFPFLVAARHLRSKKSGFLTAIALLSILSVAFSSCSLSTTMSVMGGFRADLMRKILGNHAHILIDKDHRPFEGWAPMLDTVRATSGVAGATPYATGEVMVASMSNHAGAVLRGIDSSTIGSVTDLPKNIRDGKLEYLENPDKLEEENIQRELHAHATFRSPDTKKKEPLPPILKPLRDKLPSILLGQELAHSLHLLVGDEISVVTPFGDLGPAGPVPKSRRFRVAGIFYTGMYEYDMKYAYITLPKAQQLFGLGDAISGIEIKLNDASQAPSIARTIRTRLPRKDLFVRDWQETNRNLFGALALERLAMFITLGIAILVAGFCVFGTLILMVQEKAREVAILKALGSSSRSVVAVFLLEGMLIGLFGATLGLALGFVTCFVGEHFGIRMNPEVYYIDRLPIHVEALEFVLVGLTSAIVCLLSTIFPAILASRLRPVDALRYE